MEKLDSNYIMRSAHGSKRGQAYSPFLIYMQDSKGNLQTIPYPSQDNSETTDTIYGVELMVNPVSLTNNMTKMVNRTQTMVGFIEEHWGEELDTITFAGRTAAFVTGGNDIRSTRLYNSSASPVKQYFNDTQLIEQSLYTNLGLGKAPTSSGVLDFEVGVTTGQRRDSASYIQFKRIVDLFRSNGCIFDNQGFIKSRYYIMLMTGNSAFKGFFDSIDITEEAGNPFRFSYQVTFKAEETVYSYVDYGTTIDVPAPITPNAFESTAVVDRGIVNV